LETHLVASGKYRNPPFSWHCFAWLGSLNVSCGRSVGLVSCTGYKQMSRVNMCDVCLLVRKIDAERNSDFGFLLSLRNV
jgi:hypothetical protein